MPRAKTRSGAPTPAEGDSRRRSTRRAGASSRTVEVSWGDQDPAAIVFYPRFFAWADASGHDWFRARGVALEPLLRERKVSFGLIACSAQFHSPARGGDRLVCRTRLEKLGDRTLELAHEFRCGTRAVASVVEVRICMDLRDPALLRSRTIPADLRAAFLV